MKDNGADPYDVKQPKKVLAELRMMKVVISFMVVKLLSSCTTIGLARIHQSLHFLQNVYPAHVSARSISIITNEVWHHGLGHGALYKFPSLHSLLDSNSKNSVQPCLVQRLNKYFCPSQFLMTVHTGLLKLFIWMFEVPMGNLI